MIKQETAVTVHRRRVCHRGDLGDSAGRLLQVAQEAHLQMAPLHHHFELLGWSESKSLCASGSRRWSSALFALTTLKLR